MPAEEANMPHTTLIFAGGPTPSDVTLSAVREIENVDLTIAADSGLHTAQLLDKKVDIVVGDFDSVNTTALESAKSTKSQIISHSTDKNFTDLELAMVCAAEKQTERVIVITAGGGRLDHQLGVVAAMFNEKLKQIRVEAIWDNSRLFALQGSTTHEFSTKVGDLIGLQSFSNSSLIHATTGLKWQLQNETLRNFETRGVSNVATSQRVSISLESGQLLVIHQFEDRHETFS